jgi:hypothetical protein
MKCRGWDVIIMELKSVFHPNKWTDRIVNEFRRVKTKGKCLGHGVISQLIFAGNYKSVGERRYVRTVGNGEDL